MSNKQTTIGRRINRLVAIAIVTAMSLLAVSLAFYQLNANVKARRAGLESTGFVFASAIGESLAAHDSAAIQRVFHSIKRLNDVASVYAIDGSDTVVAYAGNHVVLSSDVMTGDPSFLKMVTQGLMPVAVDVVRGGENVGRLVMVGDISTVRDQLLATLGVIVLSAIVGLLFALALARRLQKRITAPIVQLTNSILALRKARRYEVTHIPEAEGETRTLVDSFNGMIGEIHNRDSALKKLAYFDPLTGLPNRASFQERLNERFGETPAGQCVILLMDIDNFKTINDTLGQVIGDALLLNVAALLREAGSEDSMVARLGGDEFGILIPGVKNADEAHVALAPFIASLYKSMNLGGHELHVSVCGGYALAPDFGESAEDLQRHASLALTQAKREGVGRVLGYRHELGQAIDEEAEMERSLRGAIAAGELIVYYQPIVSTKTTRVDGYEALLRWRRGDGALVSPAKFIPIAEKSGLITDLGNWVLRKACQDARAWLDLDGTERFVSVNVSASQLLLSDFVKTVDEALQAAQLPAHMLCLELTESLFIGKSTGLVKKLLDDLKALGVSTALDDFGTGYSSLSYLENLSFDKLKIDRAFVRQDKATNPEQPLLHGIASLARALNFTMVAEGAETEAEVATLKSIGVEFIQGYFYSKPLPLTEALAATRAIEGKIARAEVA
ncbi:MAG: EAL domain-containing protein [Alphaproteobacteria bacterium]|nr:EAL domain-containing protein [Alphaproteobacteria bacterium]